MKLTSLGSNQTQLELSNGTRVLFSYETPVAAVIDGVMYRTEKKWSVTTSKHITQFGAKTAETRPQEFFDNLVKGY